LRRLVAGETSTTIPDDLSLSGRTASTHATGILAGLGLSNQINLVGEAIDRELVGHPMQYVFRFPIGHFLGSN